MARIRRSKANTKAFQIIPKEHELNDKELLRRKYKDKRLLMKDDYGEDTDKRRDDCGETRT